MVNKKTNDSLLYFILGLSVLLLATDKFENALMIGVCFLIIYILSNLIIMLFKKFIKPASTTFIYILISVIFITLMDYLTYIYLIDLHNVAGIFLPLIVISYLLINKDNYLLNNKLTDSLKHTFKIGFSYMVVLLLIASLREIIGLGTITIIDNLSNLIGYRLVYNLISPSEILPISIISTPFGALLIFGILIAIYKGCCKKGCVDDVII